MSNPPLDQISDLIDIMKRLRDPDDGCPWDVVQNFKTIAPYTIEEAYEVADAIERDDMDALKDELGDLLLQVVFHSRMAEEAGHFAFNDVVAGICDKMIRRHPHIFDNQPSNEWDWEAIKASERSNDGAQSALEGVATALPALMRAQKLQKRAARVGFDWSDPSGAAEKLQEEIGELKNAQSATQIAEEAGDVLFSAVNLVRKMGVTAEDALRAANSKFERRFKLMERIAGEKFETMALAEKETAWQSAKQQLRHPD